MKLPVRVTYKDKSTVEAVAGFADFVDFERTWQRSVRKFEEELRLTDIAWLAWSALSRSKRVTAKFAPDWIETVEECEVFDEEEAPAGNATPTHATP
jgi:hypothetical protein